MNNTMYSFQGTCVTIVHLPTGLIDLVGESIIPAEISRQAHRYSYKRTDGRKRRVFTIWGRKQKPYFSTKVRGCSLECAIVKSQSKLSPGPNHYIRLKLSNVADRIGRTVSMAIRSLPFCKVGDSPSLKMDI